MDKHKNNERIIRKIERCLALSKSSNEHEAAAALRQAKLLMNKYEISDEDLGLAALEVVNGSNTQSIRKPPAWIRLLHTTVAQAFGCSIFYNGGCLVLVGEKPRPTIAMYAKQVLERQVNESKKKYFEDINSKYRLSRSDKINLGKAFCEGWVVGCMDVVASFAEPLNDDTKEAHCQKVSQHFNGSVERITRTPKVASDSKLGQTAASAGYIHGKKANITIGVDGKHSEDRIKIASNLL